MSKGKTIVKEIRIHIHDNHYWVEYETKTGSITKIECLTGLEEAVQMANALNINAEQWTEEKENNNEQ